MTPPATVVAEAFGPLPPPAPLRARVLRAHARRRHLRRGAPVLAMVMAAVLALPLLTGEREHAAVDWQARSRLLEDTWRRDADTAWLRSDARARPLLSRLERIDASIAGAHAGRREPGHLEGLWRERSEVLAALVKTREQGGTAVLL
jgi:hypothetical protein